MWDRAPEMDEHQRLILGVGQAKRISLPITDDQSVYQEMAEMLRGLATEVDFACRGLAGAKPPNPAETIWRVSVAIDSFNRKKKAILKSRGILIREGRPTNKEAAMACAVNRAKTVPSISPLRVPHLVGEKE